MSNLVHVQKEALAELQTGRLMARPTRSIIRRVDRAVGEGLVAASRVQAAGYVTHVAVQQVGMLSKEEVWAVESCPSMDPLHKTDVAARTRLLVDNFTAVAAREIAELGY